MNSSIRKELMREDGSEGSRFLKYLTCAILGPMWLLLLGPIQSAAPSSRQCFCYDMSPYSTLAALRGRSKYRSRQLALPSGKLEARIPAWKVVYDGSRRGGP